VRRVEGGNLGEKIVNEQSRSETEIFRSSIQSMPDVRKTARIFAEVWDLQNLFPEFGLSGKPARCYQIELVDLTSKTSCIVM